MRTNATVTLFAFCLGLSSTTVVNGEIFVGNTGGSSVTVYSDSASGDVPPDRIVQGGNTQLGVVGGVAVDTVNRELFVSPSLLAGKVAVYPLEADGDQAPIRVLEGPDTQIVRATGIAVDPDNDELYVVCTDTDAVLVFDRKAQGNVEPLRVVKGPATTIYLPYYIFVDLMHDELYVASLENASVLVFPRTADGDVAPIRTLSGPMTQISNIRGVFVGLEHDELYTVERDNGWISTFPRTADGDVAPLRRIVGATTQLSLPQGVLLTRQGELIVACEGSSAILGFPRTAVGDAAPTRVIAGGSSQLAEPGYVAASTAAGFASGLVAPISSVFKNDFESGDTCGWSSAPPGSCGGGANGEACADDGDCISGLCLAETTNGWPGGMCVTDCTATSCAVGELCFSAGTSSFCLPTCAGQDDCRDGYSCHDAYSTPPLCLPDCTTDSQCPTTGNCNPWLGVCTPDQGLGRDGEPCFGNVDCESNLCLSDPVSWPGGYCASVCNLSTLLCPSDGVCLNLLGLSLTGICLDGCDTSSECRVAEGYYCDQALGGVCIF